MNAAAFGVLDADAATEVAALCARSIADAPDALAIRRTFFGDERFTGIGPPPVVRGDPDRGVVATVVRSGVGFVRLLVVDPGWRGRGLGRSLLEAGHGDLPAGVAVRIGTDAPDYLFPGVDTREMAMLCLAERAGYVRGGANFNLEVDLTRLPSPPADRKVLGADVVERDELGQWLAPRWPGWSEEVLAAQASGTLVLTRDERGINGFCAWDVNRRGWLGPIAVRPTGRGRGVGGPLLLAALHRMRDSGLDRAEIAWVGPMGFYARLAGARVCRTYAVWEKPAPEKSAPEKAAP